MKYGQLIKLARTKMVKSLDLRLSRVVKKGGVPWP